MINKNLIQKFADIEYPKCGDYNTRRYGNDRMNEFIAKSLYNAIELSDRSICGFKKIGVETRFCFADEGPDYELYKGLMSNKEERLKNYFMNENLKSIESKIKIFNKEDEYNIPACWTHNEIELCEPTWIREERDLDNHHKLLNDQDRLAILEVLKEQKIDFEKRLNTWWKKYGADKLHTWTYWADR